MKMTMEKEVFITYLSDAFFFTSAQPQYHGVLCTDIKLGQRFRHVDVLVDFFFHIWWYYSYLCQWKIFPRKYTFISSLLHEKWFSFRMLSNNSVKLVEILETQFILIQQEIVLHLKFTLIKCWKFNRKEFPLAHISI